MQYQKPETWEPARISLLLVPGENNTSDWYRIEPIHVPLSQWMT